MGKKNKKKKNEERTSIVYVFSGVTDIYTKVEGDNYAIGFGDVYPLGIYTSLDVLIDTFTDINTSDDDDEAIMYPWFSDIPLKYLIVEPVYTNTDNDLPPMHITCELNRKIFIYNNETGLYDELNEDNSGDIIDVYFNFIDSKIGYDFTTLSVLGSGSTVYELSGDDVCIRPLTREEKLSGELSIEISTDDEDVITVSASEDEEIPFEECNDVYENDDSDEVSTEDTRKALKEFISDERNDLTLDGRRLSTPKHIDDLSDEDINLIKDGIEELSEMDDFFRR